MNTTTTSSKPTARMLQYLLDALRTGGRAYLGSSYSMGRRIYRPEANATLQGLVKRDLMRIERRKGDNPWGYMDALITDEGWKYLRSNFTFYGCEELAKIAPQLADQTALEQWIAAVRRGEIPTSIDVPASLAADYSETLQSYDVMLRIKSGHPLFIAADWDGVRYFAVNHDVSRPFPTEKHFEIIYGDDPVTLIATSYHTHTCVVWKRVGTTRYQAAIYWQDKPGLSEHSPNTVVVNVTIDYGISRRTLINWPGCGSVLPEFAGRFMQALQTASTICATVHDNQPR